MKTEIPEFLIEMSKQMNNENVRCTAEPIWAVCYDEWLTCADGRGDKEVILICDDGEYAQFDHEVDVFDYLKDRAPEWCMSLINENDDEEDDIDELSTWLDLSDDFVAYPNGITIEIIELQKVRKTIKSCLTEEDANYFIQRKQHDYARLYTYVESMVFCPQMIELRSWIKSLSSK